MKSFRELTNSKIIPRNRANYARYIIRLIITIPLLPWLLYQGRIIRKSVPRLPDAKTPEGATVKSNTKSIQFIGIGESTMAGVGVKTHEQGFAGAFGRKLSDQTGRTIEWSVFAKSGATANQISKQIIPSLPPQEPQLVLLAIGGNDAFQLTPPWKWSHDVQQLIDRIREKGWTCPVVFLQMPPIKVFPAFTPLIKRIVGDHIELLGHVLEKVVDRNRNTFFINEELSLIGQDASPEETQKYFSDGVHPSQLTYQTWADLASDFVTGQRILSHH